jgi:hypothetical protein
MRFIEKGQLNRQAARRNGLNSDIYPSGLPGVEISQVICEGQHEEPAKYGL